MMMLAVVATVTVRPIVVPAIKKDEDDTDAGDAEC